MSDIIVPPIHFKLQTWAPDKETGLIKALILPSIHFFPDDIAKFAEGGTYDEAFNAFKKYCKRMNDKLEFVGDAPK